jgi:hypothetical protein
MVVQYDLTSAHTELFMKPLTYNINSNIDT